MKKSHIWIVFIVVVLIAACAITWSVRDEKVTTNSDYKAIQYLIEGKQVTLGGTTNYFGNDLVTDLNNDGKKDIVFLVTHSPNGTGVFYYAVAALNTDEGYVGSDGYFLGDRIAPQSIGVSSNPRHKNVIVVNYADRAPGESMVTKPSVGTSAYIKLSSEDMRWGIVQSDFEGESR